MGKRGPKPKKKKEEEIKTVVDGAGTEEAGTTQDEPVANQAAVSESQPETAPKEPQPGMKFVPNLINPEAAPFEVPIVPPVVEAKPEVAKFDTCRYHEEFEPKVFKESEIIPADWKDSQKSLKRWWVVGQSGTWERKDKE